MLLRWLRMARLCPLWTELSTRRCAAVQPQADVLLRPPARGPIGSAACYAPAKARSTSAERFSSGRTNMPWRATYRSCRTPPDGRDRSQLGNEAAALPLRGRGLPGRGRCPRGTASHCSPSKRSSGRYPPTPVPTRQIAPPARPTKSCASRGSWRWRRECERGG